MLGSRTRLQGEGLYGSCRHCRVQTSPGRNEPLVPRPARYSLLLFSPPPLLPPPCSPPPPLLFPSSPLPSSYMWLLNCLLGFQTSLNTERNYGRGCLTPVFSHHIPVMPPMLPCAHLIPVTVPALSQSLSLPQCTSVPDPFPGTLDRGGASLHPSLQVLTLTGI